MVVGVDVPLKHLQHSRLVNNNIYMIEIAFPILPIALSMQEIVELFTLYVCHNHFHHFAMICLGALVSMRHKKSCFTC
jgi:hypothetical protein